MPIAREPPQRGVVVHQKEGIEHDQLMRRQLADDAPDDVSHRCARRRFRSPVHHIPRCHVRPCTRSKVMQDEVRLAEIAYGEDRLT
nr:hypothetical protein StreXyl84_66260 [Streptomyces sp. Xyl84]